MSRIELDADDRRAVEYARRLLRENEPEARPEGEAAAKAWQVDRVGKLLAAVDVLLGVIDGLPDPIQESDLDRQPHPGRGATGRSGFDGGERS